MTFLAPAKLINLFLSPLHLSVARKSDPLQPHQTPQALTHAAPCAGNQPSPSLFSPPSSTWEDVKEIVLVAKTVFHHCKFCSRCISDCCVTSHLISPGLILQCLPSPTGTPFEAGEKYPDHYLSSTLYSFCTVINGTWRCWIKDIQDLLYGHNDVLILFKFNCLQARCHGTYNSSMT